MRDIVRVLALVALIAAGRLALAQTLALPDNLVAFDTPKGESFLLGSRARDAYFELAANFVTQKTQSYCGVASIVMVLNAMKLPAPAVPEYEPYRMFTQDNVLDAATEQILPREVIGKMGMTLDQLGRIIATRPVSVEVRHASESSVGEFRARAQDYLARPDHFVLVNYLRKALGQERGGHISPLAAYDAGSDRFLVLDVARYKYPPVWVKAEDLFAAMNTPDADNDNKSRGFVLVAKAVSQ